MNYNEKVISILNSRELTDEQKAKLEEIFPDLRESKDEMIRKVLLSHFSRYQKEEVFLNNITICDIVAYLEKQGEKKTEVKYVYTKFRIGDIIVEIKPNGYCRPVRVKYVGEGAYSCESDDGKRSLSFSITMQDEYKLVEQKPADKVEPKFKVGDTIYYNSFGELKSMIVANVVTDSTDNPMYEDENGNAVFEKDLIEQKHAETEKGAKGNDREIPNSAWSKDDEYYYGIIQYCLNNEIVGKADKENAISWFQSLKERVPSKKEWSKEDEQLYNDLSDTYYYNDEDYPEETYKLMLKRVLDWMTKRAKSLKPQSQWKPSDLPHWQKSTLPNDNTTGFNSDYFCHKGYCINYKELFEKLPKDD